MQQQKCLVCFCSSGAYYIPIKNFRIYKCPNCGLEYTDPTPTLKELEEFYSKYTDVRAAPDVVRLNSLRNLNILKSFGYEDGKYILDFGTGGGNFVDVAGEWCLGIDFKKSNNNRIFQNLSDLPIKKFDFITLWGVLEHLRNPMNTLIELRESLIAGGIFAMTTVDAESVIPYYYKPVEHLTYWTKKSISHLFSSVGISILDIKPYTMMQKSEIYIDNLLSRTPEEYRQSIKNSASSLPKYVEVPTNEILILGKYD